MKLNISAWAFLNKKLVYFIIACLCFGGVKTALEMSKLEDPSIPVRMAMIVTTFPGASAHEVELEVTDHLEKAINEMSGVANLESHSLNDLSIISVELEATLKTNEIEQQWDILRRKVENASNSFPEGARKPIVKDDFGEVFGMMYALTGDGLNDRQMSDYAELIKREVSGIEGVSRVEIYGKRTECININLLQDKMANMGVMPMEVIQTLNGQNSTVYSGYFENGTSRVRVSVSDKFKTVEDIEEMLIQGHDNDQLKIKDIAKVEKGYEQPTRNQMFYDGEQALGISIACSPKYDILKVGSRVKDKLKSIEERLPVGIEYHKVFFQPERVGNALGTFLINLLESVLIVVVVLIFTMGFRSGIIIGTSLVVIVLGSFLILGRMDGTLQRVSLASLIVAMGMLVDNAIVVVDGILVDLKSRKTRLKAMTAIGQKTAMPLLGATLIAILAFLPIFLSPDTTGLYVHDLFVVLAVSLLLSWILALIHVPLMADRLLPKKKNKNMGQNDALYGNKAYKGLEKILSMALNHRLLIILSSIGLLVLSAFGYRYLKQGFFPDMDYDQLYMEYKLPEGTNYTQVESDLNEIREFLQTRDEVTHVTTSLGGTPSRYNLVRSIATPSLSYGELIVDFKSSKLLVKNLDEIQDTLTKRYPQAYVKLKRYNLMYKKFPIEVVFCGPDPEVLHRLTDSTIAMVNKSDKLCLPTTDWEPKVPSLVVEYNQPDARKMGLSRTDIGLSMLSYTGGIPIGTFFDGIHPENIYINCTDNMGNRLEDLNNASVFGILPNVNGILNDINLMKLMSGQVTKQTIVEQLTKSTPLSQVAKSVDIQWEDPVVMRYNGQRSQRVQCSPMPGVGTEAARQSLEQQLQQLHLPEGYSMTWEGEKKASDQSMRYLFNNFPLAILIIIGILIMLFKDYKKPLIIFCCIPLVLIGVIPAMLISGKTFGFVAIVGVLGLIGMTIKNGIVLMDEIDLEIKSGIEPKRALIESSKSRLRAVMMAAATTVLGMIPLITDALFGSLAVTIMGGLMVGTLVTLIFLPVLYSLFFKIK